MILLLIAIALMAYGVALVHWLAIPTILIIAVVYWHHDRVRHVKKP